MKKILLIGALAIAAATSAYAQGSVTFANSGTTSRVWWQPYPGAVTTWIPVGNQFTVELMYAPDGTPTAAFDATAVRVGATTTFGPVGGLFSGGSRTVQGITPAGGFGLFQVRVWETAFGSSYQEAIGRTCNLGASSILRVDTGDPTTTPPGTPTALTSAGLAPILMQVGPPCPEPSTYALGALAAAVFVFLRRRK